MALRRVGIADLWEDSMLEFAIATKKLPSARNKQIPGPRGPRSGGRDPYGERGVEPDLEDLIGDPVTQALMARDGVSPANLRDLISSARVHLKERRAA